VNANRKYSPSHKLFRLAIPTSLVDELVTDPNSTTLMEQHAEENAQYESTERKVGQAPSQFDIHSEAASPFTDEGMAALLDATVKLEQRPHGGIQDFLFEALTRIGKRVMRLTWKQPLNHMVIFTHEKMAFPKDAVFQGTDGRQYNGYTLEISLYREPKSKTLHLSLFTIGGIRQGDAWRGAGNWGGLRQEGGGERFPLAAASFPLKNANPGAIVSFKYADLHSKFVQEVEKEYEVSLIS
jgi:hypothetical protein